MPGKQDTLNRVRLTVPRAIALYGILVSLCLGAADYFYARAFFPTVQPTQAGVTSLINRLAWYAAHSADYNLVFLGDSRTYCGIHAELLDPTLGTSSLNLATMSHWFPTQLPFAQDIAPLIPKGTTVVWSIGSSNFVPSTGIQRTYPVGIENAFHYMAWNVESKGLADNVFYYTPALHFLSVRSEARNNFVNLLDKPFETDSIASIVGARAAPLRDLTGPVGPTPNDAEIMQLNEIYRKDPRVAYVDTIKDNGNVTSLTLFFQRGSYYRIELDHDYFRHKQKDIQSYWGSPQIDPSLWRST